MATQTVTETYDDLDGTPGALNYAFSLEGDNYTIDLAQPNAQALVDFLQPYIDKATHVKGVKAKRTRKPKGEKSEKAPAAADDTTAIREWAAGQGISVNARGRISKAVREAYQAALPAA